MQRCDLCGKKKLFGGITEDGKFFCSQKCAAGFKIMEKGFCKKCISETTDEPFGGSSSFNGIGTGLGFTFRNSRCPECSSVIKRKWFYFFFPIVPLDKFRIIELRRKQGFGEHTRLYLSRKLKIQ